MGGNPCCSRSERSGSGKGSLENLRLIPENPTPTYEGLAAIANADYITFGPGSWFSSVLPHVLVAQQRKAIVESRATKVIILNLDAAPHMKGDELAGSSPQTTFTFFEVLHLIWPVTLR